MKKKKLKLSYLPRPHRAVLVLAFIAVLGEAVTDLLEPWPLKIVFDYVFGTKPMPSWLSEILGATFGLDKVSILNFAILAVIVIAVIGALSAYAEKYLTTSVGQWVMHDLRRVLYHHIQRLSLAYHDQKPAQRHQSARRAWSTRGAGWSNRRRENDHREFDRTFLRSAERCGEDRWS